MHRNHRLTPSRTPHDDVRASLSNLFTAEAFYFPKNLSPGQSSIALDSLAGPASISSFNAAAITTSRSRVAC
jgi:hypothetical protein